MAFNGFSANSSWFNCAIRSSTYDFSGLEVYAFSGVEKINEAFEFTIDLVSKNGNLDLTEALGRECLLTIADKSGGKRLINSVIRQAEQLRGGNQYAMYRVVTAPRVDFLRLRMDHRIYQGQTVPQIIQAVLDKHLFLGTAYAFKLWETYKEREFCCQYGESDYHFIQRLVEEEGLYWWHNHTEEGHCLCFADTASGPAIAGESALRYHQGSGQPADTAVISRLDAKERINSDRATYRDYNFMNPSLDLTGEAQEPDWKTAPVPQAMDLETYQFPHIYQTRDEGERYARLRLQQHLVFRRWIEGESDVSRLVPGYTFTLNGYPRADVNRDWFIVEVRHEGKQPGVLQQEAPAGRGLEYKSTFTAIPDDVRFVPEFKHKKVRIDGVQTAIVTGPKGADVRSDKYARVFVRFHWDREEKASCPVRVAQGWAGSGYGAMVIPRIGQEVVVAFLEGDPNRPMIVGCVPNAANMPPCNPGLAADKSRSVFRSMSTPGPEKGPRGYNELSIQDMLGSEEISVRAERNVTFDVKNDWNETIKNNRSSYAKGKSLIKADDIIQVDGGKTLIIQAGGQSITLDASGIRSSTPIHVGGPAEASPAPVVESERERAARLHAQMDPVTRANNAIACNLPGPADIETRVEKLEADAEKAKSDAADKQIADTAKADQKKLDDKEKKGTTTWANTALAVGGQALKSGADNKVGFLGAGLGALLGSKDSSLITSLVGGKGESGPLTEAVGAVTKVLGLDLSGDQIQSIATGAVTIAAGLGASALAAKAAGKSVPDALGNDAGKLLTAAAGLFIDADKKPGAANNGSVGGDKKPEGL